MEAENSINSISFILVSYLLNNFQLKASLNRSELYLNMFGNVGQPDLFFRVLYWVYDIDIHPS